MVKRRARGYVLIVLMMVVFLLAIGLTVAVPVLETELRREKEEELIFRGLQYVEAIRLFQAKTPGRFPASLKELTEKGFLRKPFPDPMTPSGEWDIVLAPGASAQTQASGSRQVVVAPQSALGAVRNPVILGVVSASTRASIRLYEEQDRYDKWLFFYGHDPKNPPKVVRLGREGQDEEPVEEEPPGEAGTEEEGEGQ
jgi:type II secretory pathway pseudopilin PulG